MSETIARNMPGISRLASVLDHQMCARSRSEPVLDLGEIRADKSLQLDAYSCPIPASDYLICRSLSYSE